MTYPTEQNHRGVDTSVDAAAMIAPMSSRLRAIVHAILLDHPSHESYTGNSWGGLHGPFARAADAVGKAHALNAVEHAGRCAVVACPEAHAEIEGEGQ